MAPIRTFSIASASRLLLCFVVVLGFFMIASHVFANSSNITSQVTVQNSAPSVTSVTINSGNDITLTANATTTIYVNFTVTDNNGCSDVFFNSGAVSSTVFRMGATGVPGCAADNQTCYVVATSTHNCTSAVSTTTSAIATTTFQVYYFAQAADASSSFASQHWEGFAFAKDSSGATSSATSSAVEVNTLTAINVTTSSINYGTLSANTDTGSTNQTATTTNAGNSTTTLQLSANPTLVSGSNYIPTSSQQYATSSFTYGGATGTALSATAATVTGFTLTAPTSTTNVAGRTFWGISIPNGQPTGTYSGTNVFTSLFRP